jgi:methyl-accepting chemotaxis protein
MANFRPTLLVRLVFVLAGVAAFSTAIALVLHDRTLSSNLEQAARHRLDAAAAAADRLSDNYLASLAERYRAVSGSPQFRANLEVEDPPTLVHYAEELLAQQRATRILFLDSTERVVAAAGDPVVDASALRAARGGYIAHGGRPYAVASVTLAREGRSLGRMAAVEPLRASTLQEWSVLCGARIFFSRPTGTAPGTLDTVVRHLQGLEMRVELSLAPEREALARSRRNLLTAGFVAIVAAFLASLFFSRGLIRPILQIKSAAERIGQGDFTVHVSTDRRDEIGDVARAFETMAADLRGMLGHVAQAADRVEGTATEIATVAESVATVTADQVRGIQQTAKSMEEINTQVNGIAATAARSAQDLNVAVEGSTSSFRQLGHTGGELNHNASILSAQVDEVTVSIEEMIRSARRVAQNGETLARAAEETSRSMEDMARYTARVDKNAGESAKLSTSVVATAEKGRDRVLQTIRGMEEIRAATETAQKVIHSLANRVKEIGLIVKVIDEVSDETNLLALNAEIIAAQAGEHGRPFSVVAGEMKDLSDRVLAGTKEIRSLISAVQKESANAIGAIEAGSETVQTGVELAAEAGESLEEITGAARESGQRMAEIVSAIGEQTTSASNVVKLMQHVRDGVDQIRAAGLEQDRGNESVLRSSVAMREVARQVSVATEEQARSAARIGENIETVRGTVEQINRALQEQSAACRQAADFLESVNARTSTNEESAWRMGEAMRDLLRQAELLREDVRRFRI